MLEAHEYDRRKRCEQHDRNKADDCRSAIHTVPAKKHGEYHQAQAGKQQIQEQRHEARLDLQPIERGQQQGVENGRRRRGKLVWRHPPNGIAREVFCDGHVEGIKARTLFDVSTDEALRRWNNDNLSHRELLRSANDTQPY